jgi:hypothetical protein
MYCIQCGKVVPQGAKFCPGCGAALELENVATTQASETSVQPSKTPWFVILGITLRKLCTSGFTLHYYEAEGLAR